ncbi:hypothetical protein [Tenacibaculum halocynthiae]|uniref:hypothetical protein n=1 Tax=Tenacibaculum halocynthiae TaxID=1254437 RepID=UPI003895CE7E
MNRSLKKGVEYENLMPLSTCDSQLLTTGDTKKAIDNMVFWAKEYQSHTQKLTSTIFKSFSLPVLCNEVHSFLYHHFQYKIDGFDQQLRSPACAWATREEGIDCKSYSILASTILLNRGISHYFRRVAQNEGEGYSHVYVVVPKNQKTNSLKGGYYTIDGTLGTTKEVVFYKKDDVFVSAEAPGGLGVWAQVINKAIDTLKPLINYGIKELITEMESCGGSVYDPAVVALKLDRDLRGKLQKKVDQLGEAIVFRNRARTQHLFNEVFKEIDLGIYHLRNEAAFSTYEHCDGESLAKALKFSQRLKTVFNNFFLEFKKQYPNYKVEEFVKQASVSERTFYFVVENNTNPILGEYRYIVIRENGNEYGIAPIFPFEANPEKWILKNLNHLRVTYSDGREVAYKKEITPLLAKVKELREKIHLGGEFLYFKEQPIQLAMYKIWLNYDNKYTTFLKEEAQSIKTANELALRDYKERFGKVVEENRLAKKRKKDKIQLGVGISVVAFLFAIHID